MELILATNMTEHRIKVSPNKSPYIALYRAFKGLNRAIKEEVSVYGNTTVFFSFKMSKQILETKEVVYAK